ncbi:MAG: glycosyltransferase [Coriobacteriia bacterium]|nr:glycosyltransferase [Coriobacteriia bacterium]
MWTITESAKCASALAGRRVCIIRNTSVEYDKRTREIARLLAGNGAEVTVLAVDVEGRRPDLGEGVELRQAGPGEPSRHPWRPLRIARNLLRSRRQHRLLVAEARGTGADVFHCMNVDTLLQGFLAARGRPVVYDSREHFATTGSYRRRRRWWWLLKERLLVPRCAAVLTVSQPIAEDLARRYSIPTPTVIYNGCEACVASAEPVHRPMRFLHLGKLFFDRHVDEMVLAMIALRGRAILTVQGWGDAERSLRELVAEQDFDDTVRLAGPCPPQEVVACASAHDVGLMNIKPETRNLEWSAGNKLFEYMAAGLAVLVPGFPVMREIVEKADCGLLFEPLGVTELVERMTWLVEHPDEVERMKRNALAAAAEYSWEAQSPKLVSVYEKALGRDSHGRENG